MKAVAAVASGIWTCMHLEKSGRDCHRFKLFNCRWERVESEPLSRSVAVREVISWGRRDGE